MKPVTILAIGGQVAFLVWNIAFHFINKHLALDANIVSIIWTFVSFFSAVTMLAFLISFLTAYDRIDRKMKRRLRGKLE